MSHVQKLGFYVIKCTSIFIVSILYFLLGSFISIRINRWYDVKEKEGSAEEKEDMVKSKSTALLLLETSCMFGVLGIAYYILRNIVSSHPLFMGKWPLDGYFGYEHAKLKEKSMGGIIVSYVMFYFQTNLLMRMKVLGTRL
jgi:hypothetical protein